jgi:hypothetical protein
VQARSVELQCWNVRAHTAGHTGMFGRDGVQLIGNGSRQIQTNKRK